MAFAKKVMGFPSDLVSFPTKLPSKGHEKIRVTFLQGMYQNPFQILKSSQKQEQNL